MSLIQDVRFAVRSFARTPGTALLALATLAIGIGANAAIFSVIHSVLIAPLPYPGADRVAVPWRHNPSMNVSISASQADLDRWASLSSIEAVTTYLHEEMVLTGASEPEPVQVVRVAPNLLAFVGAQPARGRAFTAEDTASEGAARVVLLTDRVWRTRYGSDPAIVGRRIDLSDKSHEIVGVLPASFYLPLGQVDVVVPLVRAAGGASDPRHVMPAALLRLKPGTTVAAAEAEITAAGVEGLGDGSKWNVKLIPSADLAGSAFKRALYVLLGAVACVLLIACTNVANVILARNSSRAREIAVRIALGAGRGRLVRQLMTENMLLAIAGGAAGVALGAWAVQGIAALRPPEMRELQNIRVSRELFAFGFAVSVFTALVFGLAPAMAAVRGSVADALKQGGRAMTGTRGRLARRALSVAEIALALILLAGAGLLIRSYARLQGAELGFNPERLLAVRINFPEARYQTPASRAEFVERLLVLVRQVPGVRHATVATGLPPRGGIMFGQLQIEGRTPAAAGERPKAFGGGWVRPGYFEALRIPIREGRPFAEADLRSNDGVIISASMARQHWPGQSALGQRIRFNPKAPWRTIVGVAGDVKSSAAQLDLEQVYQPMTSSSSFPAVQLLVAADVDPMALVPVVKGHVWSMDPKLALKDVATLEQRMFDSLARPRFNVVLLSVFAAIGLLLAAIGVYGVIGYSVGQRRQEIGVRMALGAVPSDIRRAVLGEALALAGVGTVIGLAGAAALTRFLQSMLFGVSATDPVTLGSVAMMLGATSIVAAWVPARRAMRVDPVVALRGD